MKTLNIFKYVFMLAGVAMLFGALALYRSTSNFLVTALTAEGTVIELVASRSSDSTTYRPVVQFTAQNGELIEFTSSSGSNPPSYEKGETVKVFYLPTQAQDAKINGFFSLWGGATILGGLGAVFFLIGGGITMHGVLKDRSDQYLLKHGTPIQADFQSVELNRNMSVNGRHPFRIVAQWQNPKTQELHVFHSNNLWIDPGDYIKSQKIRVYIDKNNPKKYCVDTGFLPKLAN